MRVTTLLLMTVLACGRGLLAQDHATPEEIEAARRRVAALAGELEALAQPFVVEGTEVRATIDRSLFATVGEVLRSLPPDNRSAGVTVFSATGTIHNDDTSHSGMPFGCGWELKLHSLTGGGRATLEDVAWSPPGRLEGTAHVRAEVRGDVGIHVNGMPCPDLRCEVALHRVTIKICLPFCVDVSFDVPYPRCDFRGWMPCNDCTIGGGFQLPASIPVRGGIDSSVKATATPFALRPEDTLVARTLAKQPGLTVDALAGELGLPARAISDALARLQRAQVVDGANQLTPEGQPFGTGAGAGIGLEQKADPAKIPLQLAFKLPLPEPTRSVRWICDNFGDQVRAVCDALDWASQWMPDPIMNWIVEHNPEISINDLITLYNLGPGIFDPLEQPSIDVPPLTPASLPLYGVSDLLVADPPQPPETFELPTSNRPLRTEAFATRLVVGDVGVGIDGGTNSGWMDNERWLDYLQVHFLDVGQGDAIWLELPRKLSGAKGETLLIDGGPGDDRGRMYAEHNRLLLYLRFFAVPQDARIDTVVVSHPHRDHYRGLLGLLENAEVRRLVVSSRRGMGFGYRRLLQVARQRGVEVVDASATPLDETIDGVRFQVLAAIPRGQSGMGVFERRTSNSSVVTKVTYREHSFLFLGDALGRRGQREPADLEAWLVANRSAEELRATTVKLGDHGSSRVGSEELLRATEASVVVLMAGRERRRGAYSPDAATVSRIRSTLAGVTVVTTSLDDELFAPELAADADDVFIGTDGHQMAVFQEEPIQAPPYREWRLRRVLAPAP